MNVFVIHSGADLQAVTSHVAELKRKTYALNALVLKNGNWMWKVDAEKKIKKSQMVVFFVGETSHKSPYIAWELEKAVKHGKPIYTVKLDEANPHHEALVYQDKFSGAECRHDKEVSFAQLSDIINRYESGDYNMFNQEPEKIDTMVLLEQYKAFLQTSEDLVTRRQNVNSFYISINSALIALFSAMFALQLQADHIRLIGGLFAVVGMILSRSWIKILSSYGNLNSSKMKIISGIEKQLPASLYDAEWAAMSDRLNKKKYVPFTKSEKRMPYTFIGLYALVFAVCAMPLLFNFLQTYIR